MNQNKCFLLCLWLFVWVSAQGVWAQNKDLQQEEINKIKKSTDYLSATGNSMKSEEDARAVAYTLLEQNIIYWLEKDLKCKDVQGYVAKSKQKYEAIPTRRGKLYRIFLYVKKQDILPISQEDSLVQVNMNQPEPQQKRLEQQEETQQQTIEVDSQSREVEQSAVAIEQTLVQTTSQKNTKDQVMKSIEVAEQTKITTEASIGTIENGVVDSTEEQKMLIKAGWGRLKQYVEQLEKDGRLHGFGNGAPQIQSGCIYYFLINHNQLIVARLKCLNGQWTDIRNGQQASIDTLNQQYPHARWVWITLNE